MSKSKKSGRWLSRAPLVALVAGTMFVHEAKPSAGVAPPVPVQPVVSTLVNVVPKFPGTRTFAAGSLIIPRDECFQYVGTKTQDPYCVTYDANGSNTSSTTVDDGLFKSYGLHWLLIFNGIPVYTVINPTKTGGADGDSDGFSDDDGCPVGDPEGTDGTIAGRDFCVNNPGLDAVTQFDRGADTFVPFSNPGVTPFDNVAYRGAPIIIDAADVPAAMALIRAGNSPTSFGFNLTSVFDTVEIHKAEVSFKAPVFTFENAPPKQIAIESGNSPIMIGYIDRAGLDFPGAGGTPSANGLVYDVVTIAEVAAGELTNQGYNVMWFPHDNFGGSGSYDQAYANITAYLDNDGKALVASCAAVIAFESEFSGSPQNGCADDGGCTGLGGDRYMTTTGILDDPVGDWGGNANEEVTIADISHPFAQIGNEHYKSNSGTIKTFNAPSGYLSGVVQLIATEDTNDPLGAGPDDGANLFSFRNKDDDPDKGLIIYFGGHNMDGSGEEAPARIYLNTMFSIEAVAGVPNPIEVSRSQPTTLTVNGIQTQYQGSFLYTGLASDQYTGGAGPFDFPAVKGHMRGFDTSVLSAGGDAFDSLPALFDVGADTCGGGPCIPPATPAGCGANAFTGNCRTVFTNTTTGLAPVTELLQIGPSAGLTTLLDNGAGLVASDIDFLITTIVQAELGGDDRSGPNIVIDSPTAASPASDRPAMIYWGATDGMFHAACAEAVNCPTCSTTNACDFPGRELWAFMPRTQVPLVRLNQALVDGTAKHFEVSLGTGLRSILMFSTGTGELGVTAACAIGGCDPALYAIDVTDPTAPSLLWERTLPGHGLELAVGEVQGTSGLQSLVFVETNLLGGNGIYVAAIDIATGNTVALAQSSPVWEQTITTKNDRGGTIPPGSGIPGGPTLVDTVGLGTVNRVLFGGLYGEIYLMDAEDGTNEGHPGGGNDKPWVQWSTDFRPVGASPTIFSDGVDFFALVVTGGFADRTGASWTTTPLPAANCVGGPCAGQFGAVYNINQQDAQPTALTEADAIFTIDFAALGAPDGSAFASAVVAGDEVFIVLDSADVNSAGYGSGGDSGYLIRGDIGDMMGGGSAAGAVVIAGGANSADVDMASENIFIGSGGKAQKLGISSVGGLGVFDSTGVSVSGSVSRSFRRLWLRVQ